MNSGIKTVWFPEAEAYLIDKFNADWCVANIVDGLLRIHGLAVTNNAVCGKVRRLRETPGIITRSPVQQTIKRTDEEKRDRASDRNRKSRKLPPKERSIVFLRATTVPSMRDVLPSIGSLMIAFSDLQHHQCHFPTGAAWCGHGVAVNSRSYCEMHQQRVYVRK